MADSRDLGSTDGTFKRLHEKGNVPTPHKVAVIVVIQQYLNLKLKRKSQNLGLCYPAQSRRRFCMLLLKLIQMPDMSYDELYAMLTSPKNEIDLGHLGHFENRMNELVTLGIENLFDLFDANTAMEKVFCDNNGIGQFGVVGLYTRRVSVALDRMTFTEMMALYKNIVKYYEKGIRTLGISSYKTNTEDPTGMDLKVIRKGRNIRGKWSIRQSELFTYQQSSLLENNEIEAVNPIELQTKAMEILQDNPYFSQAFFLNYLNYVRIQEIYGSLATLHGAFETNPIQALSPANTRGFQYLSLNLAILHWQFDHPELAKVCLGECIKLAQQVGDKHCLQHANSWECVFNNKTISAFDKCVPDESDLIMVLPASQSIQFLVKIASLSGFKPSKALEALLKSDDINGRNSILELAVSSIAERASIWTLFGKNEIASVYNQLLMRLSRTWTALDVPNSEAYCQVLCSLALDLSFQAEFMHSSVILHHASSRFPRYPLARNWMLCNCYRVINRAECQLKWNEGLKASCQLYVFDKNVSKLHRGSLIRARRHLTTSSRILSDLLEQNLEPLVHVRALLSQSYAMMTQDHIAPRLFNVLNKAVVIAKEKYLDSEISEINFILSCTLLLSKMPYKALEVVQSSGLHINSNGRLYDKAKTIILFVNCLVSSAKSKNAKLEKMKECMEMINKAINYFKKFEAHSKVKSIYIFLAKFFHSMDVQTERNKYAYKFRQYDNDYPSSIEYLNFLF